MLLKRSYQASTLILMSIFLIVECRKEVWTCKTKTDQECDFPFTHNGKTYKNCTSDDLDNETNYNAWCATETDEESVMVEGKHGECDFDSCEYVKTGLNNGMVGGLVGTFVGVGVALFCSGRYAMKKKKGCCKNSTTSCPNTESETASRAPVDSSPKNYEYQSPWYQIGAAIDKNHSLG